MAIKQAWRIIASVVTSMFWIAMLVALLLNSCAVTSRRGYDPGGVGLEIVPPVIDARARHDLL